MKNLHLEHFMLVIQPYVNFVSKNENKFKTNYKIKMCHKLFLYTLPKKNSGVASDLC
jgi:hypothetical protein